MNHKLNQKNQFSIALVSCILKCYFERIRDANSCKNSLKLILKHLQMRIDKLVDQMSTQRSQSS